MTHATEPASVIYQFGEFALDTEARSLSKNGAPRHVERQVFDLLALLIEQRHRVVTRDELIDAIWGGRIVSDAAVSTRINSVRRAVEDDGRAQRVIKTITRSGFRFVSDVVEESLDSAAAERDAALPLQPETDDRPSLAVLPFVNLSKSEYSDSDFLGDGIAEEIVSVLSKSRWLFLIASNSSRTQRDPLADATSTAKALCVRYLLRGSFRIYQDRIRLNVTLVDGVSGATLSSARHDAEMDDPFDLIDKVAWATAGALLPDISLEEHRRSRRVSPGRFDVWSRYLLALELLREHSADSCEKAVASLEGIVRDRPDFAVAYARLATGLLHQGLFGWGARPRDDLFGEAFSHAQHALALDPSEALACDALASVYQFRGEIEEAGTWARRAIGLNPTCVAAYGTLATALAMQGDADGALETHAELIRVSPRDPDAASALMGACIAYFIKGDFAKAARAAREHETLRPNWYGNKTFLASSLAYLGDMVGAQDALKKLLVQFPGYSIEQHRSNTLLRRSEDIDKLLEGLRRAGLPE